MSKRSNAAGRFAFAWAVLVSLGLLFIPIYGGNTIKRSTDGTGAATRGEEWFGGTLLSVAGAPALLFIVLPLLVSIAPLIAPPTRRYRTTVICAIAVTALVLLAIMTLGVLHLPTAIALAIASGDAKKNDEESPPPRNGGYG